MLIYIDESGDLGWTFDKPYRFGGSSRYLTISSLIVPSELKFHPKRLIKELYTKLHISPKKEIKGADLNQNEKEHFTNQVIHLLSTHPEIQIFSITVQKENVLPHIRVDGNKLYNYMIGLSLLDKMKNGGSVTLLPDPRTIKVASGNCLEDYLSIKLWFELNSTTVINTENVASDKCDNIKFIDIVTHIIWDRYENNNRICFDRLLPHIKNKNLFFK